MKPNATGRLWLILLGTRQLGGWDCICLRTWGKA